MANNEEGSLMIVTLLLTGRATPFLHNGVVYMGDEKTYVSHNNNKEGIFSFVFFWYKINIYIDRQYHNMVYWNVAPSAYYYGRIPMVRQMPWNVYRAHV